MRMLLVILSIAYAAEPFNEEVIKKDALYADYQKAMQDIDREVGIELKKKLDKSVKNITKKKKYAAAKQVLAKKAKKLATKKVVFNKEKQMMKLSYKALNAIKPNAKVEEIKKQLDITLKNLAGKDAKLNTIRKELMKKFQVLAERRVKLVVKDLIMKIEEEKAAKNGKRGGKTEQSLAKKAISYIHRSNSRMEKAEKYLKLSCKAHPLYCGFFKRSFVAAHPIRV